MPIDEFYATEKVRYSDEFFICIPTPPIPKPVGGFYQELWARWQMPDVCPVEDTPPVTAHENALSETPTLEQRFHEQATRWGRETTHLSSPAQQMMHPSYQAILGMGNEKPREIVRLMIRDMQQHRRPWFWALSYFAQDNPVRQSDAGNMDRTIKAWVNWEKAQRLP
jgi:hypothetical protein